MSTVCPPPALMMTDLLLVLVPGTIAGRQLLPWQAAVGDGRSLDLSNDKKGTGSRQIMTRVKSQRPPPALV